MHNLGANDVAYSDEGVKLIGIGPGHKSRVLEIGRLSITKSELAVGSYRFPLGSIGGTGLMGVYKMMFSVNGQSYELRAAKVPYCGRKYFTFYEMMKRRIDRTDE